LRLKRNTVSPCKTGGYKTDVMCHSFIHKI
jgi:hypothetical protein